MSIIAWDGRTLAADKRASMGTLIRTTTKIFRFGGALLSYSGEAGMGEELVAWFKAGAVADDFPARQRADDPSTLLVIDASGIRTFERSPHAIRVEDQTFAIGSGRDFALAAMHLGKTAAEAVAVAIALDSGCGNGIDTLELK